MKKCSLSNIDNMIFIGYSKIISSEGYKNVSNIIFKLYVVTPTGYIDSVNNYSYKFTQKGKYVIRYFAVDEAGNVAILDNEIIVE